MIVVTIVLLLVAFALLLGGAVVFTNSIEWGGARLNLGSGAVGSVLAAVATALPESIIPIVAIIAGTSQGQIAVGAIVGAPFLLGTLGMVMVGGSVLLFRRRREQGTDIRLHRETTRRDLIVFLVFFGIALALGLVGPQWLNYVAAGLFLVSYAVFVWRTITRGSGGGSEEGLASLYFDPSKHDPPTNWQIVLQIVIGLAMIIGGAHLFVHEVESLAKTYGVSALALALVLAPLATELPEKANSVLWTRQGKDALAVGNITGAMVFQSMIPVAVALIFLQWELSLAAIVPAACALAGGALVLAIVEYRSQFRLPAILVWATLYLGTIIYVIVAATSGDMSTSHG